MKISDFRPPKAQDVLRNVTKCRHYCGAEFEGRALPIENSPGSTFEKFSIATLEKLLAYGVRIISQEIEYRDIVLDECNLGKCPVLRLQTMHGTIFRAFHFDYYIGLLLEEN